MRRIIVIGCPGSGKSTFSKKLHHITGLPLYHLDMMYWNADRTKVDREVFLESLANALQESEWIIDGNYSSTMEQRMQACDTVVFLDYPTDVCLSGVRERKGKVRTDIPWTEPEQEDREFIETIKNYNTQSRPRVLELLERYRYKEIYIFTDRTQADDFLKHMQACTKGDLLGESFVLKELTSRDDILELYHIYKHCMYKPTPGKYATKADGFMRDESAKVLACKNAGKTVGVMVISFTDAGSAEIVGIATDEAFRGCGAGIFMINTAMERFGLKSLYAETDDDAVGFYRTLGFDVRERTQAYGGEAVTRYDCILKG